MQRVVEMESEPVVGDFYMVPCVKYRGEWAPVIGQEHTDKEYIKVGSPHLHYDLRFTPAWMIQERVGHYAASRNVQCDINQLMMGRVVFTREGADSNKVRERKMRCLRFMPVFPLVIHTEPIAWMRDLENAYQHTQLNCARCPHRGMPLSKENADENGNVVCPGHGLQFNLETGKLVSRLKAGE
jgi:hypothetical protein